LEGYTGTFLFGDVVSAYLRDMKVRPIPSDPSDIHVDDQKIVDLRCVAPEVERKEPGANKAAKRFAT